MKTLVEKVDISITTIKNTLPQEKPVAGKFRISENCETASFVEEDAVVIYGDPKSKRLMRGKGCSVWYNPEKKTYKICAGESRRIASPTRMGVRGVHELHQKEDLP